jgi:hypothetical protein
VFKHDGIHLLVLPELLQHTKSIDIGLSEFLFFRNLNAVLELSSGIFLKRGASWA